MIKTRIRDLTIKGLVLAVAGVGLTLDAMAETNDLYGYQVECSGKTLGTCRHESWRFIAGNKYFVFFVDTRKAKQKDVVWVLSMPKKGHDDFGKISAVMAMQMKCSTGERRYKGATKYDKPWAEGSNIGQVGPTNWELVRPGSVGEAMYDYVCNKK